MEEEPELTTQDQDPTKEEAERVADSTETEQEPLSPDELNRPITDAEIVARPGINSAFEAWKDIPREKFLTAEEREAQQQELRDKGAL